MSVNKYYRVPEAVQLKARSRRLHQQLRDGKFESFAEFKSAKAQAIDDYDKRNDLPIFAHTPFIELVEEEG